MDLLLCVLSHKKDDDVSCGSDASVLNAAWVIHLLASSSETVGAETHIALSSSFKKIDLQFLTRTLFLSLSLSPSHNLFLSHSHSHTLILSVSYGLAIGRELIRLNPFEGREFLNDDGHSFSLSIFESLSSFLSFE